MVVSTAWAGLGAAGLGAAGPAPGHGDARALALAALLSWLAAEALGAYMLGNWLAAGGLRGRASTSLSVPVLAGHVALALTGLACWVTFLATGSPVPAWLAVALLAPAIGLGISTVTVWTPYPLHRPDETPAGPALPAARSDHGLARALDDETLAGQVIDDLLASMLASAERPRRRPLRRFEPLVPAAHGILAIATFLLAMLAAISALS